MTSVELRRLSPSARDQFIQRLQDSFTAGAAAAFADDSPGPVITVEEIVESMDRPGAESWDVRLDGDPVGGAVVSAEEGGRRRSLELLFIDTAFQGNGLGAAVWRAIESGYPEVEVWRTMTPYSDARNIHFYVNKCGFRVVEFFHPGHRDPNAAAPGAATDGAGEPDMMIVFEKIRTPFHRSSGANARSGETADASSS